MGKNWKQLKLLLWKNVLLQARKPIATTIEILLPILFVAILLVIRLTTVTNEKPPQRNWNSFDLTSDLPPAVIGPRTKKWKIAFAPDDARYVNIMKKELPNFLSLEAVSFINDKELLSNLESDLDNDISKQNYLCGVIFTKHPDHPQTQYYLRFPADARNPYISKGKERLGSERIQQWFTQFVFPRSFSGLGPRNNASDKGGPPSYFEEGFTTVQRAVDFAIISDKNNSNTTNMPNLKDLNIQMQRFPYPQVTIDPFIIAIQNSLPLLLMLSLLYSSITIVKSIAEEKEKRLKVIFLLTITVYTFFIFSIIFFTLVFLQSC